MAAKHPSKDFKTIKERIEILKSRKLLFRDEEVAEKILLEKNYFDIVNGFETLLLNREVADKEYLPDSYFEYFHMLYTFDKDLSAKILKLIDSFENRLKSSISYRFCEEVFGNNPDAPPDSYLNPMMYENPYSIHHRIRSHPSNNWSTDSIQDINNAIDQPINGEVRRLSVKISRLSTSIQYSKQNNKMLNLITECERLLLETNKEINRLNPTIGNIPPASNQTTVSTLIPFPVVTLNITFSKVVPTSQAMKEQMQEDIDDFLKKMKEINLRISKVYARLAFNNNSIIDNVLTVDIWGFMFHHFFQNNHKINKKKELNYVEFAKEKYAYLKTYDVPPLWVIIKTLDLGGLRMLLFGLKSRVLDQIVIDMGLTPQEKILFLNSVKIIQDLRNSCAHFNLVNRFRTHRLTNIDTNLKQKLGLTTKNDTSSGNTHYEIRLFDTLKVLSQFEDCEEIHNLFYDFFCETKLPEVIMNKFLDRMGNSEEIKWLEF
ncbi:Abi family protein [Exiguobacterium acetylicum]|uniref:Abi family protein n=1 Tax=Exiguobacterium acetylicum TaxID=41170 RepID=UPI0027DFB7AE|nr:Abi family protein [Exiguobacterium acetylicum]MDQ6468872.1 Abi family protein [Exiguobacterium acetylicum]